MRGLWIGLVALASLSWAAAAETVPGTVLAPEDSGRWNPPAGQITITDDPEAPFVSYFTPPYRKEGSADLTWSMMATRWRSTGEVRISVGIRILHAGAEPWTITGWRVAESGAAQESDEAARSADISSDAGAAMVALQPLTTCTQGDCRTYEAASFDLPLSALGQNAGKDLEIRILTAGSETPAIQFPASILRDLRRNFSTRQTSLAKP